MESVKFRGFLFLWVGSIISIILALLLIHYKIRAGLEVVPLHYNVIVGVDVFGPGTKLYRIPLIGATVLVINFLLSKFVPSPKNFLAYAGALVSFTVNFILLSAVLFLLRIT